MIKPGVLKYFIVGIIIANIIYSSTPRVIVIHHYINPPFVPDIPNEYPKPDTLRDTKLYKGRLVLNDSTLTCNAALTGWFSIITSNNGTEVWKGGHEKIDSTQFVLRKIDLSYVEDLYIIPKSATQQKNSTDYKIFCNSLLYRRYDFFNSVLNLQAKNVIFDDCNFEKVKLNLTQTEAIRLSHAKLKGDTLRLFAKEITLRDIRLDSVNNLTIKNSCTLDSLHGDGSLILHSSKVLGYYDTIKVKLKNVDIEHLKFPHSGMKLIIDPSTEYELQVKDYKLLIQYFDNLPDEKREYDIAYQKLLYKHANDWWTPLIRKYWDNFGYSRDNIFINSFELMFLFFGINLFFYPEILYKGYALPEFIEANHAIRTKKRNLWIAEFFLILNCLLYTGFVFWGLKLSLEKIKISNIGYSLLIIIEYIVGIICLAYIANIIITK